MILNIPDQIVSAYVCATVIFGGLIIMFGSLWCALFIGSKAIFELAAHCKFWRESEKNLVIDHSHQSGRIRGMLCNSCNKGLGFFRDNPALLERASDYVLGKHEPIEEAVKE